MLTGDRAPGGALHAKFILRSSNHHICRMTFAVQHQRRRWDFTNTISFQYGEKWGVGYIRSGGRAWHILTGGKTDPQDYQICEFLRKDPEQTWDAVFSGPGPLPDGASRRRFVPRPLAFPKAERTPRAVWIQEAA